MRVLLSISIISYHSLTVQSQDVTWGKAHSNHVDLSGRKDETSLLLYVCDTKTSIRF